MSLNVRKKIVATAIALALTGLGGIALAVEAPGPSLRPHDESSTSSDSSSSSDSGDAGNDSQSGEHPDNHGADVSAAAHDCPKEGHGECVRAVAQDNEGQDHSSDESDQSEAPESEAPESESPESEAPETDGSSHSEGHGHGHGG